MPKPLFCIALMLLCRQAPVRGDDAAAKRFGDRVAPVLIRRCLACHSGGDPQGGLDLSTSRSARAGGDSGPVIVAGKPLESLLWRRVSQNEMPPKNPLSASEKTILREWIAGGGVWEGALDPFRFSTSKRAGYDWWALQPLSKAPAPSEGENDGWSKNGVDRFIAARLAARKLSPAEEADRRTLIRRLSFDLLGLPPTPEEVAAFESDRRPDAYERLADRLLASPHYGIRWGRHWLDVARFGESQGFERDKLRDNAWPYRDWVIDALNRDMPYDEFARRQIAGDVLYPRDGSAIVATGFLVAGPYDEVGQNQQSAAMKAIVRQDELEEIVGLVSQTFLGLTANCARCHDHKFDPISQREYYQLAAALAGVRHGSRDVRLVADDAGAASRAAEAEQVERKLRQLEYKVRQRVNAARGGQKKVESPDAPRPVARWSFDTRFNDTLGALHGKAAGGAKIANGQLIVDGKSAFVATIPLQKDLREKTLEAWVRLGDLNQRGGGVISVQTLDGRVFDAIVFGERKPGHWMAGSDHFRRTKDFGGPAETAADRRAVHVAIAYHADGTIAAYRDGQPYGAPYKTSGPVTFLANKSQVVFGLRHNPSGGNRMLRGAIEAAQLYDRALTDAEVAQSAATRGASFDMLLAAMTPDERASRDGLQRRLSTLYAAAKPAREVSAYVVAPRAAGVSHILLRGNAATPGEPVAAAGVKAIVGLDADFGLPPDAAEADRRRKLAEWITHPANPLFARVIVNRLWHYHFGVGLVETPNDFGFNGGRPSHPELIDYLARELIHRRGSLKSLHRLIVTSATYRQSSRYAAAAAAVDARNRLLWRKSPRRQEAETLRDTILSVAGELNQQQGGPGYRDFETFTRNTQFYVMKDPIGPAFNRRSVYRTWVRSGRNRFLDVFDCPDPSTKTPKRAVTTTPLQALALLNNSFVLRMSDRFADRLRSEAGDNVGAQVRRAYRLAYHRAPNTEERQEAVKFVAAHGLGELCRVIFNSNEFLYVE